MSYKPEGQYGCYKCFIFTFPVIALLIGSFYLLSLHNYLLYHSLVELLAAVVAFTLFSIGWNTRKYAQNKLMIIFAVGYLVVGAIDVLYILSFEGMGIFPHYNANLPPQFWIAARFVEGVTVFLSLIYCALIEESLKSPYQLFFNEIFTANKKLEKDIQERKNTEEALLKSEQKFRTYAETAPVGLFIIDDSGGLIEVNPAACRISGYTQDELLDLTITQLLAPVYLEAGLKLLHEAWKSNFVEGEVQIRNKNEKNIWLKLTAVKVAEDYLIAFCSDITGSKQAEQKIMEYAMDLELQSIKLEELYTMLNEEINKARQIHEQTIPKNIPTVEGISFAAHYQPALRLGGDFYKVTQTGNKLVIYLSDVSGHGLDGAMLSVFVKEAIDSYLSLKPDNIHPQKILQHLDKQYRQENYSYEYFVAIFLAVFHLDTRLLVYTSAGFQDSPFVCMGNGKRTELHSEGLPISSYIPFELMNFQDNTLTLTPGTTIFFNTDGLTEQRVAGICYSEILPKIFYENSHLPPYLIAQAVCENFRRFNDGSLQGKDDITFLVMQVNSASD